MRNPQCVFVLLPREQVPLARSGEPHNYQIRGFFPSARSEGDYAFFTHHIAEVLYLARNVADVLSATGTKRLR